MKKLIIFACSLMAGVSASAQDVLITQEGDVKKVYDVEVGPSTVFYKEADKADAPTLRIKKADVIMIKRKDGTKYDLGNGNNVVNNSQAAQSPQTQAAAPVATSVSAEAQRQNDEAIRRVNDYNPKYQGDDTGDRCKRLLCLLGYGKDSQIINDDIEIECVTGALDFIKFKKGMKEGVSNGAAKSDVPFSDFASKSYANPGIKLRVKNKSGKTLYLDLGNTFIMRKGVAMAYYVPSSTSTSNSSSSGMGVNLGAVAGAVGVGGALGTLASGIGVGGSSTSATVNTTYSQRVISVPPMSVKELDVQLMFPNIEIYCDGFGIQDYGNPNFYFLPEFSFATKESGNYNNGETHNFSEETSPVKFGFFVSYSDTENCQNEKKLAFNLYLRQIIGFDKKVSDMYIGASLLPKVIPDYKNYPCFVGAVIEGGLVKRLPKDSKFKRGDK